jgi:hypothetical protein
MSEDYQVIAVQADLPSVRAALEGFAQSLGGHAYTLAPAAYDARWEAMTYFLFAHGEWVVLEATAGLMPALAVSLSQATHTDVVCRDVYSPVGYEHFSLLQAGEAIYLFTYVGGGDLDMQGIDPATFVVRIRPGEYEIAPGDDPAGEDFPYHAPGIFCHFIAPFDLDAFFWETWESDAPPVECVRLDVPTRWNAGQYYLGGIANAAGISWQTVLERTRRDLTHAPSVPAAHVRGGRSRLGNLLRWIGPPWRR